MVSDKLKRFYKTLIYIPNFLSWVIIAGVIVDLLGNDGAFNTVLSSLGFGTVDFLGIPLLKPIMILMLVLALGNVFNAGFDQIYNLYAPVVYEHGDIIDTYIYRFGIQQAQYAVAAAVGLFKSAISCILVIGSYILADKLAGYKIW